MQTLLVPLRELRLALQEALAFARIVKSPKAVSLVLMDDDVSAGATSLPRALLAVPTVDARGAGLDELRRHVALLGFVTPAAQTLSRGAPSPRTHALVSVGLSKAPVGLEARPQC